MVEVPACDAASADGGEALSALRWSGGRLVYLWCMVSRFFLFTLRPNGAFDEPPSEADSCQTRATGRGEGTEPADASSPRSPTARACDRALPGQPIHRAFGLRTSGFVNVRTVYFQPSGRWSLLARLSNSLIVSVLSLISSAPALPSGFR
jgi:hypothetical protein